ncbi:hypothetical protein, partial [Algoriphagus sp.]|uniref:hypothetical protein n=1 Tax=Algoriphagus sp. TaxID=1872435 RepID=UPI00391DB12B
VSSIKTLVSRPKKQEARNKSKEPLTFYHLLLTIFQPTYFLTSQLPQSSRYQDVSIKRCEARAMN